MVKLPDGRDLYKPRFGPYNPGSPSVLGATARAQAQTGRALGSIFDGLEAHLGQMEKAKATDAYNQFRLDVADTMDRPANASANDAGGFYSHARGGRAAELWEGQRQKLNALRDKYLENLSGDAHQDFINRSNTLLLAEREKGDAFVRGQELAFIDGQFESTIKLEGEGHDAAVSAGDWGKAAAHREARYNAVHERELWKSGSKQEADRRAHAFRSRDLRVALERATGAGQAISARDEWVAALKRSELTNEDAEASRKVINSQLEAEEQKQASASVVPGGPAFEERPMYLSGDGKLVTHGEIQKLRALEAEKKAEAPTDLRGGIQTAAAELGIDPIDLATVISYETAGTFDPKKGGPTTQWGRHRGLIQFGEPQAKEYGVDWNDPIGSQLGADGAIVRYLKAAGVKPGMGILDVYSAVNAGRVGRYGASDANNGGAPGTVADKVNNQMSGHRRKAEKLLGGSASGAAVYRGGLEGAETSELTESPVYRGGLESVEADDLIRQAADEGVELHDKNPHVAAARAAGVPDDIIAVIVSGGDDDLIQEQLEQLTKAAGRVEEYAGRQDSPDFDDLYGPREHDTYEALKESYRRIDALPPRLRKGALAGVSDWARRQEQLQKGQLKDARLKIDEIIRRDAERGVQTSWDDVPVGLQKKAGNLPDAHKHYAAAFEAVWGRKPSKIAGGQVVPDLSADEKAAEAQRLRIRLRDYPASAVQEIDDFGKALPYYVGKEAAKELLKSRDAAETVERGEVLTKGVINTLASLGLREKPRADDPTNLRFQRTATALHHMVAEHMKANDGRMPPDALLQRFAIDVATNTELSFGAEKFGEALFEIDEGDVVRDGGVLSDGMSAEDRHALSAAAGRSFADDRDRAAYLRRHLARQRAAAIADFFYQEFPDPRREKARPEPKASGGVVDYERAQRPNPDSVGP